MAFTVLQAPTIYGALLAAVKYGRDIKISHLNKAGEVVETILKSGAGFGLDKVSGWTTDNEVANISMGSIVETNLIF